MRRSCALIIVILLVVTAAPPAAAAEEHDGRFGAVPGDPRTREEAGVCLEQVKDRAETSCAVLYGHFFDLLNKVPINTQRPPEWGEDLARGIPMAIGYEPVRAFNHLTMWSTPGFVEYPDDGGDPGIHNEKGITSSVRIDTEVPIVGYWYMSADTDEMGRVDDVGGHGPDVGVLPCLKVRMVLQTGREPGHGTELAIGEQTKTVVSARAAGNELDDPDQTMPCPDSEGEITAPRDGTEFRIELEPLDEALEIPASEGFIVHVHWSQFNPSGHQGDNVYMTQWNLRTGPEHLNRVVLPTRTTVTVDDLTAIPFDGSLFVRGEVNSPWGSYDVDPESIALRLFDGDGEEVPMKGIGEPILRYSFGHNGHFKPVRAVIPWDHQEQGLEPGTYTIEMSAHNWQHLGRASDTMQVEIRDDAKETVKVIGTPDPTDPPEVGESPLPVMALLASVLALLAAGGHRLRRSH